MTCVGEGIRRNLPDSVVDLVRTCMKMTAHFGTLLLVVLLLLLNVANGANPCQARNFGHDSVACVCTESYCDSMDPIQRTPATLAQLFESDRGGKRLDKTIVTFNQPIDPIGNNQWNVSLNHGRSYQEIHGFGGSWSDAAALSIGSLTPALQRLLLSEYFSENGIEYSMARTVISGCDFSTRPYTYDDTPWDWDLVNWALVEEDTNYKIPQIKLAQELSPRGISNLGSSWSPPAWLKNNGELNHGGQLLEGPGSIFWQTYAKYLLKFFQTYKDNGVNWWGMTIQNEPMTGFDPWFPWNTCGFTAGMERDFAKTDLGPIMEAGGFTPENFNILALDHNRPLATDWADTIYADPDASRYVKGLGVHWYFYGSAGEPEIYDAIHDKYPDKFLLATEACNRDDDDPNDRVSLGNWRLAEEYADDIQTDLAHWVTGWIDWNLALDREGGPNWVNNLHSAPVIASPETGEFYKNTQFYAMAHFSKFLPAGSRRLGTFPEQVLNDKFQLLSFSRPDGGVVVTVINRSDETHHVNFVDDRVGFIQHNVGPRSFNSWIYYLD